MAVDFETLALAKKYTDGSISGISGSLAGKNCTISSITDITGGHRVTFQWTADDSTTKTQAMDVMDGEDGKGIASASVNENNHLIITYTDGTTTDAGEIEITAAVDSVNGETGNVVLTASDLSAYTSAETDAKIQTEIEKLDVSDSAVSGSYVTAVSEADGKISVTREAGDATPTEDSAKMVQSGGVYTALAGKQDTLTFDDAPTSASTNPVKSGGVYSAIQEKVSWDEQAVLGAYNELPFSYANSAITTSGVTFAVDENGVVTCSTGENGATANAFFVLMANTITNKYKGMRIVGCQSGGAVNTYSLEARIGKQSDDSYIASVSDIGNGGIIPNVDTSTQHIRVYVRIESGTVLTTPVVFKPMITRDLNATYDDYVPYAMSNRELTESIYTRSEANILGAKNLIDYKNIYSESNVSVTFDGDSCTALTTGVDSYPSVVYRRDKANTIPFDAGSYILTVNVTAKNNDTTYFAARVNDTNVVISGKKLEIGENKLIFTATTPFYASIFPRFNNTAENASVTFDSVMLRLGEDQDDTYVPYAMTNRELTEAVGALDVIKISSTDLNVITETGTYFMNGSITSNPSFNYGWLCVYRYTENLVKQVAYSLDGTGLICTRTMNSGTWGSWYKFTGTEVS